MAIRRQMVKEK